MSATSTPNVSTILARSRRTPSCSPHARPTARFLTAAAAILALCGTARAQYSIIRVAAPVSLARPAHTATDAAVRVDSPRDAEGRPHPFLLGRDGAKVLPLLATGRFGAAVAISAPGTAVAGWSHSLTGIHAVRWDASTTIPTVRNLGSLPGASVMLPVGISDRGDAIAGFATFLSPVYQPWRWTSARGLEPLATDAASATATAISADGSLIAGESFDNIWSPSRATIWLADNRPLDLRDTLAAAGLDVTGWRLTTVTSVSPDGRTLAGRGELNNADAYWLVTIPAPGTAGLLLIAAGLASARRRR